MANSLRTIEWAAVFKKTPKIALSSFGMALCVLMIASVGSFVMSSGSSAFDPGTARIVFTVAFVISFIYLAARAIGAAEKK